MIETGENSMTFDMLEKIASLKWDYFSDADWNAFMGCQSQTPRIAHDNKGVTYVIDGDVLQVFTEKNDELHVVAYELNFTGEIC